MIVRVKAEIEFTLEDIELESVHGDVVQAVQNALGFAGVNVIDAEVDDFLEPSEDEPAEDDAALDEVIDELDVARWEGEGGVYKPSNYDEDGE